MFQAIILPIFKNTRLCYTTSCNTQSSVLEDGQNNWPKHVELTGIINKLLLLHLVGCLYFLYQRCTVKQMSGNEIYLLIKYIKSVLWRLAKRLSYIESARCLEVNLNNKLLLCLTEKNLLLSWNHLLLSYYSANWYIVRHQYLLVRFIPRYV